MGVFLQEGLAARQVRSLREATFGELLVVKVLGFRVYGLRFTNPKPIIEIYVSSVKRTVILEFKKMAKNANWVVNQT